MTMTMRIDDDMNHLVLFFLELEPNGSPAEVGSQCARRPSTWAKLINPRPWKHKVTSWTSWLPTEVTDIDLHIRYHCWENNRT